MSTVVVEPWQYSTKNAVEKAIIVNAKEGECASDLIINELEKLDGENITSLRIGYWGSYNDEDSYYVNESPEAILLFLSDHHSKFSSLKDLYMGDLENEDSKYVRIESVTQSCYSGLLSAYPGLETLYIVGSKELSLGTVRHENLKKLVIKPGIDSNAFLEICNAHLPELKHLELHIEQGEENDALLNNPLFSQLDYFIVERTFSSPETELFIHPDSHNFTCVDTGNILDF
ncbi:MAG: hypothetical protein GY754_28775 [bacterium]|nr:hypothetical protein [bacterium]